MKHFKSSAAVAAFVAIASAPALAAPDALLRVTEVAPWSSGNSPVAADWFEVTNTGSSAVNISGWRMDDNSNSYAASVALTGITTIAAGESVIFIETTSAATIATFKSLWFGATPPAALQFGTYSGSGVGLSTGGDAVNLFDTDQAVQAKVSFGASTTVAPFRTFDNAAGLNNVTLTTLAVVGVNGAFAAAGDASEIGSPGTISAVPEAESVAMLAAGLAVVGAIARRRKAA